MVFAQFEKWNLDFIGPLPPTRRGKQYILSDVDYMTRWPEVVATRSAKGVEVARFFMNNLCCRFGVPLEIVTNQGFSKNIVKEFEV